MKLLVQPTDGIDPIVKAIRGAKKSVEIVIFRFDRLEVRQAMVDAVRRGIAVNALIAFTNRGGEKKLRQLEADFLANGITVARTADDLKRYHGKLMLVDRREVYVLGFNLTHLDIDRCRSFGLVTRNAKLVREAARLFEADCKRQAYRPEYDRFVVSPANARNVLNRFIDGAKKELLIYDPEISDREMVRRLRKREEAGVKIRIIGTLKGNHLPVRVLRPMRLHVRLIVRDRDEAFLGSQSLRQQELESRREIGVIFRHGAAIRTLVNVFKKDWAASTPASAKRKAEVLVTQVPKQVTKAVRKQLPVRDLVSKVVEVIRKTNGNGHVPVKRIEKTVRKVVRSSVEDVVKEAVQQAVADTA